MAANDRVLGCVPAHGNNDLGKWPAVWAAPRVPRSDRS